MIWNFISKSILWNLTVIRRNQLDKQTFLKGVEQIRGTLMATKQEVLDAIAAEKAEANAKLDAQSQAIADLNTQIQALKDQIAAGSAVTPADLDEILTAVHDIVTP